MKIIVRAKNLEPSEALNKYIEEKFLTLQKYVSVLKYPDEGKTLAEVSVEIEKVSNHHRKGDIFSVKTQLHLPGREIMAIASGEDLFKVVIEARDELKQEIEKYKLKKITNPRREQRKSKGELEI